MSKSEDPPSVGKWESVGTIESPSSAQISDNAEWGDDKEDILKRLREVERFMNKSEYCLTCGTVFVPKYETGQCPNCDPP